MSLYRVSCLFSVILSVNLSIMMNVVIMNGTMFNVVLMNAIILYGIMLNVGRLNVLIMNVVFVSCYSEYHFD